MILHMIGCRLKSIAASPLLILLMLAVPTGTVVTMHWLWTEGGTEIPVAVVDQDESEYSHAVLARFAETPGLSVTPTDEAGARRGVETQSYEAAFVIHDGFGAAVRSGRHEEQVTLIRSPSSLAADLVGESLAAEVMRLVSSAAAANQVVDEYRDLGHLGADDSGSALWQEAWRYAESQWRPGPLMTVDHRVYRPETAAAGSPTAARPAAAGGDVPGDEGPPLALYALMASLVLFNALLTAREMINDRRQGVTRRLMVHAGALSRQFAAHAAAILIVSAVTGGLTWVSAAAAGSGLPGGPSPGALALLGACVVCITGLALLAGAVLRTEQQLQVVTPLLTVATAVLGGSAGPLGQISRRFATIQWFTPQGWLIGGLDGRAALLLSDFPLPLSASPVMAASVLAAAGAAFAWLAWRLHRRPPRSGPAPAR